MRPYWKGYLKLALVSCPIALHAARSSAERIAFRQINKATGHRLRQQLIDEETREPVAPEHKGRATLLLANNSTSSSDGRDILPSLRNIGSGNVDTARPTCLHSPLDQPPGRAFRS